MFAQSTTQSHNERERPSQQSQPLSKTNHNDDRRRKVSRHHQPEVDKDLVNKSAQMNEHESDKENAPAAVTDMSAIDENTDDSDIMHQAELMGL